MSRGINVLENKSELEKAMAKQRLAADQKQKEAEVILMMMIVEALMIMLTTLMLPIRSFDPLYVNDWIRDKSR